MKWTKWQLEFMREHPEVFDEAEDPSALFRKIGSFTKYRLSVNELIVLVLGWAEARKFGIVFAGKVVPVFGIKRFVIYLKGPIASDELFILSVDANDSFTQEQTFEAIKSRFNSEYLFPLSDLPYVYNGIKNLIMR